MTNREIFLSNRSLTACEVLQKTDLQTVELLSDKDGERFVLKTCHKISSTAEIEREFLASVRDKYFVILDIPILIEAVDRYLLMSYVEREHHTRESILHRHWDDSDVDCFLLGLAEFQSIKINPSWFSIKQRAIGFVYPVVKLLRLIPAGLRNKAISFQDLFTLFGLVIGYLFWRPTFRNVTTHYDLTTYNYAFSPNGKMSILDFELAYYLGDPLFDAAYFVTIPPARIRDWSFQRVILRRQLEKYGNSYSSRHRLRLILILCCLVRYLYFINEPVNREIYLENIKTLVARSAVNEIVK